MLLGRHVAAGRFHSSILINPRPLKPMAQALAALIPSVIGYCDTGHRSFAHIRSALLTTGALHAVGASSQCAQTRKSCPTPSRTRTYRALRSMSRTS